MRSCFQFKNNLLKEEICIIVLVFVCIVELIILINNSADFESVDISNTTCSISEHLGRRIFFHICTKDKNHLVYDLRYFWREEEKDTYLKPKKIGVQLTSEEFTKVCNFC